MKTDRRAALSLITAALAAGSVSAPALSQTRVSKGKTTFVLIHGAWHGGWCWRYIAERLTTAGHRVFTPSLTGLADRSHLLSPGITLQTHIDDVANLFRWEDLSDVVLVAHSYGGWPVSGALETIGSAVKAVVFVDAFLPENGERVLDLNSEKFRRALLDAIRKGEAGRPVPDAASFGIIDPRNREWVQSKMTPQPTGVATQRIILSKARERVTKKAYVRASGYTQPHFDRYVSRLESDSSWQTYSISASKSGHDVMIDAPDELTSILMQYV